MDREALFSQDRKYRYSLTIKWGVGELINFLMLNPSTADEVQNDPTVERCERRARMWGYSGVIITNIFALRSTDPHGLYMDSNPVGSVANDVAIIRMAHKSQGNIICGWGGHGELNGRGLTVKTNLHLAGFPLMYLRMSKATGQPWHPLYVPYSELPQEWK